MFSKNYFRNIANFGAALGILVLLTGVQPIQAQPLPSLADYEFTLHSSCHNCRSTPDAVIRVDRAEGGGVYHGSLTSAKGAVESVRLVITPVRDPHSGWVMAFTLTITPADTSTSHYRRFEGALTVDGRGGCAFLAGSYYDSYYNGLFVLEYGPYPFSAIGLPIPG